MTTPHSNHDPQTIMNHQQRRAIVDAAADFRRAERRMRDLRDEVFPIGSTVAYKGSTVGIVASDLAHCPPDHVPIRFANGNVWWKQIDDCEPAKWKDAPREVRLMKLRRSGIVCGASPRT